MDSEFMLDAAQPKTELHDHQQAEEQPERHEARQAEGDEEDAAADIDDQREMAQPAHAEALDDARIEERRDSHHSRHGREGDGEERAEPEDVDEDLLARGHKAEHGAEQEHAGKAVEQRQPVREDDAEAAGNRLERELAAVFGVERLGQAEEGPRLISVARPAMNTKIDCHGPVSSSTWPTPGAMMGMAMKTMNQRR